MACNGGTDNVDSSLVDFQWVISNSNCSGNFIFPNLEIVQWTLHSAIYNSILI